MLRKTLTTLALVALVAAVPAVAFAGNGQTDTGQTRAQLQVDPGTCDGEGVGMGYGLRDGSELAPAPGDGTGFGAMNRANGQRGGQAVGPMDGTGQFHVEGMPIAPRDGTGLRLGTAAGAAGVAGQGQGTCPNL